MCRPAYTTALGQSVSRRSSASGAANQCGRTLPNRAGPGLFRPATNLIGEATRYDRRPAVDRRSAGRQIRHPAVLFRADTEPLLARISKSCRPEGSRARQRAGFETTLKDRRDIGWRLRADKAPYAAMSILRAANQESACSFRRDQRPTECRPPLQPMGAQHLQGQFQNGPSEDGERPARMG